MRRTELKRRTPLRAKKAMLRGKSNSRYAQRERAWFFMGWVKTQPCCISSIGTAGIIDLPLSLATVDLFRCRHRFDAKCGVVEADHAGERQRGSDSKSKDRDTIPLCYGHHWDRTNSRGIFEHMTKPQRVEWRVAAIEHTHNQARMQGVEIPDC